MARWAEAMLAALVVMYFVGFVLTDTGPRLMLHVVPFTLGWVVMGLVEAAGWLDARLSLHPLAARTDAVGAGGRGDYRLSLCCRARCSRSATTSAGCVTPAKRLRGEAAHAATVAGPDTRVAFYADAGLYPAAGRPRSGRGPLRVACGASLSPIIS